MGKGEQMFMLEWRDMSWWYWLATVLLLCAGMAGWNVGYLAAMALTGVQIVHFTLRERSTTAFPVQVRLGYLLLLLASYPAVMQPLYWVPIIGTWAQLIFGYCTMARLVSLLPWNASEPFSLGLVTRTFFTPPVRGNILQGQPSLTETADDTPGS